MMKLTFGYGVTLYYAVTLLQGRIAINTLFLLPSFLFSLSLSLSLFIYFGLDNFFCLFPSRVVPPCSRWYFLLHKGELPLVVSHFSFLFEAFFDLLFLSSCDTVNLKLIHKPT